MRWPAKQRKRTPAIGDARTIRRFLLLPQCLDHEWRWMEFVFIEQEYVRFTLGTQWLSLHWAAETHDIVPW